MQKILAIILAILTAIFGFLPGLFGKTGTTPAAEITVGEWLKGLVVTFNMTETPYDQEPYYATVPASDPYFESVQIAYEWGVVTQADSFKTSDALQKSFLAATLVRVAELEAKQNGVQIPDLSQFANANEIAAAISNGLIALTNGKFKDGKASLADAKKALENAKELWSTKTFDEEALAVKLAARKPNLAAQGLFDDEEGTGDETGTKGTELSAADVFETVAFQGDFEPDLTASVITDESGKVLNEGTAGDPDSAPVDAIVGNGLSLSDLTNFNLKDALSKIQWKELLKKIKFSFNIGPVAINVAVLGDGFRVGLSGEVYQGVRVTKNYELTNFDLNAKMDADLLKAKINNAYVRLGYDLTEQTIISGDYAASLAQLEEQADGQPIDVLKSIEQGLLKMLPGQNTVNLFTVTVPVPNLPALTISIRFSLTISVDGKISLTVVSSELKGYEIVNNNGRWINQSVVKSRRYDIDANAEFKANIDADISILGFCLVDVGVTAGLGAEAYVNVVIEDPNGGALKAKQINLPFGMVASTTIGQNNDLISYTGEIYLYGILEIYYGRRSVILNLIPAQYRDFKIFGKNDPMNFNSTIYRAHIVDGQLIAA
ncbi:MAG: hypothetical protein LBJ11_03775 [Oscillospiraceae bacterium]|jgi:hypothetical protein|nr:hypothetical protein [Oscillospiraceae bacterium]